MKQEGGVIIRVDNNSAIELAKNLVNHERSKHIDVKFHFFWEQMKEWNVEMVHVGSWDQIAHLFTKPLPTMLFNNNKNLIKMRDGRSI